MSCETFLEGHRYLLTSKCESSEEAICFAKRERLRPRKDMGVREKFLFSQRARLHLEARLVLHKTRVTKEGEGKDEREEACCEKSQSLLHSPAEQLERAAGLDSSKPRCRSLVEWMESECLALTPTDPAFPLSSFASRAEHDFQFRGPCSSLSIPLTRLVFSRLFP